MIITNATVSALPQLLSTKEAAKVLGISHRTLEDWRLKGGGPRFTTIGRLVRYRVDDLVRFIDGPSYGNTGEVRLAA